MSASEDQALAGAIFEESALITLAELSRLCAVEERHIIEFVDEGVLDPFAAGGNEWRFHGSALRRTRLALRLERDLEINLAGVALALELLDQLEQLRRELRARR